MRINTPVEVKFSGIFLFLRDELQSISTVFQTSIDTSATDRIMLSILSIKPAGLKLSVFWHYIDENSLKTPPGHKKPFTAACHADIKNHLRPHGLLKVHSPIL